MSSLATNFWNILHEMDHPVEVKTCSISLPSFCTQRTTNRRLVENFYDEASPYTLDEKISLLNLPECCISRKHCAEDYPPGPHSFVFLRFHSEWRIKACRLENIIKLNFVNWCLHSGHINIKQKKLFESAIDGRRLDKECNQHSVIEPRRCGRLRE